MEQQAGMVTFDLTAYIGQSIYLRWDAGIEAYDEDIESGWRIDDIMVAATGFDTEGDEHNLLTWDPSPDDPSEVGQYNVYRSEQQYGSYEHIGSVPAEGGSGVRVSDDFQDGNYDGWTVYDGSWSVEQSGGNYWLEGQGQISAPFTQAYGRWEWDFQLVRTAEVGGQYQLMRFYFIQDQPEPDAVSCSGYYVIVTGDVGTGGQINLWRLDNGEPPAEALISGTWTPDTDWNTLAIERETGGQFTMYLNGNSLGTANDNTYTASTHIGFRHQGPEASDRHRVGEVRVSQGAGEGGSFVDPFKGTADDTLWWYIVRAVGTSGLEEDNTNAVREPEVEHDTFDIPLYAGGAAGGWNFVSFNLVPLDTSLEAILADIGGNYDKVMYFDALIEQWLTYVPGRAARYNNLHSWTHRMGLWIHMTTTDTLTITGTRPTSTDIPLYPGWTMVSLPSSSGGNHGLPGEIDRIGYFDASTEYNLAYSYSPGVFVFEPGRGYWLYNPGDTAFVWTVDY